MLLQGTQSCTKNQRNESQAGPTYFLCAKCLIIRLGSSQAVQWSGLLTSTAWGIGLIPNQVTKIPHAVQWGEKKKTILNEFFLCFYICSLGASGFLHLHYSHEERKIYRDKRIFSSSWSFEAKLFLTYQRSSEAHWIIPCCQILTLFLIQ